VAVSCTEGSRVKNGGAMRQLQTAGRYRTMKHVRKGRLAREGQRRSQPEHAGDQMPCALLIVIIHDVGPKIMGEGRFESALGVVAAWFADSIRAIEAAEPLIRQLYSVAIL